jgi:hypothetical protein
MLFYYVAPADVLLKSSHIPAQPASLLGGTDVDRNHCHQRDHAHCRVCRLA